MIAPVDIGLGDAPPPPAAAGTLETYEIIRRLACGGMAELHLARTRAASGPAAYVVIKQILPKYADDPRLIQMFLDEARIAAALDHPNIAPVLDIGQGGPRCFFAMPYLHGHDARDVLKHAAISRQRIPLEHVLAVVSAGADALHHAHERRDPAGRALGIVHRDVSPSNLFITYGGEVKLMDFGVAQAAGRSDDPRGAAIKGKISYTSPEQCRGEPADRQSDVFSLGVVLYEMATVTRLFRRNRAEDDAVIIERITGGIIPPPRQVAPDLPAALEDVILRALAVDPRQRYASAAALGDDLRAVATTAGLALGAAGLGAYIARIFGVRAEPWHESDRRAATGGDMGFAVQTGVMPAATAALVPPRRAVSGTRTGRPGSMTETPSSGTRTRRPGSMTETPSSGTRTRRPGSMTQTPSSGTRTGRSGSMTTAPLTEPRAKTPRLKLWLWAAAAVIALALALAWASGASGGVPAAAGHTQGLGEAGR